MLNQFYGALLSSKDHIPFIHLNNVDFEKILSPSLAEGAFARLHKMAAHLNSLGPSGIGMGSLESGLLKTSLDNNELFGK